MTDPETDDTRVAGTAGSFRVGEWHAHPARNELCQGRRSIQLEPKAMALPVYLAENAGRVAGREQLFAALWPGLVVSDDTLTQAVIKLRKALGDHPRDARYIQTIPKKGYRLLAPVTFGPLPEDGGPRPPRRSDPLPPWAHVLVAGIALALIGGWAGSCWIRPLAPLNALGL